VDAEGIQGFAAALTDIGTEAAAQERVSGAAHKQPLIELAPLVEDNSRP
jgi:hypothetical protein